MGEKGIFNMGGREGDIYHGWERMANLRWVERRAYLSLVGEKGVFSMGGGKGHI